MAVEGLCRGSVGKQELTVLDDGVTVSNPFFETRTRWVGVDRLAETGDHLYLYLGANAAHIIPKRGQPEASLQVLRDQVAKRIPAA